MERESDKHSPRVDDAMAHEVESLLKGAPVESRSQESRLQEDPDVGPGIRADVDDSLGSGISLVAAEHRAELARHLAVARFPARREELLAAAAESPSPEVTRALESLPEGETYQNVQAVWVALGGEAEQPHTR